MKKYEGVAQLVEQWLIFAITFMRSSKIYFSQLAHVSQVRVLPASPKKNAIYEVVAQLVRAT